MDVASRIRVMPEPLANQIAAGEVVERPASVVKELVENSLDAEATEVTVEVEDGGRALLRVTDDGFGMTPEEAVLSLKRHATSKIRTIEDLHAIGTLGFRGEALPSIVSVSRFEMETRPRDALAGVRLVAGGDAPVEVVEAGLPHGTRISIRDLFFNVPARRKFLRTPSTEAGQIAKVIAHFALGYPHVRFRLTHNGRKVHDLPPERSLSNRVFAVLGREVAARLFPVSLSFGIEVEGLVSAPDLDRLNADGMYTFVNGRFIRDRLVQHAITSAYGGMLDRGRYPYVVLFLRVPPALVDVNVHPAKSEVRFVKSGEVHEAIVRAVKLTLAEAPWLAPSSAPPDIPPAATPVRTGDREQQTALPLAAGESPAPWQPSPPLGLASVLRELEVRDAPPLSAVAVPARPSEAIAPPTPLGFFGRMRYVGQVHRTFLLCESDDALHVIDQHAAHERVTFERLLAGFQAGNAPRQGLLFPLQIEVAAEAVHAVEAAEEALARLGFEIVPFGTKALVVRALPAAIAHADVRTLLDDVLAELQEGGRTVAVERKMEAIVARLACHGSVRAGDLMTDQEVRALLRELDRVDYRANCPHGRPVVVSHPFDRVARWFERT